MAANRDRVKSDDVYCFRRNTGQAPMARGFCPGLGKIRSQDAYYGPSFRSCEEARRDAASCERGAL